ncbi:MAG: FecCD family ABC transporter permease [Candidatus Fervidibacter sp.]|uniref:FecCD family ABC transporter permease n=1 Tax=Candidatus Fervidibacter sp. TaxID=3100871 RepID=UPI00404B2D7B
MATQVVLKVGFWRWQILLAASVLLVATALGASFVGAANLTTEQIWALRVPRVLLSVLVGASLASSGTCLQALFRNPLADPFILGIAAGSAFGAAGALLLGAPSFVIPFASFLAGLTTSWLVYLLGRVNGVVRMDTLLLAGVAVNAFLSSMLTLLLYLNAHKLLVSAVYFWLMGGFQMATWREVWIVLPYALLGLILPIYHARALNALLFGEEWAHYSGVEVETVKRWLLVASALSCGASVSVAGIIGFVGLVAPHLVRLLLGPHHRTLVPGAAVFGGLLLLCCDTVSRTIARPAELPVGIFTAFLGVPFFLFLLRRARKVFG